MKKLMQFLSVVMTLIMSFAVINTTQAMNKSSGTAVKDVKIAKDGITLVLTSSYNESAVNPGMEVISPQQSANVTIRMLTKEFENGSMNLTSQTITTLPRYEMVQWRSSSFSFVNNNMTCTKPAKAKMLTVGQIPETSLMEGMNVIWPNSDVTAMNAINLTSILTAPADEMKAPWRSNSSSFSSIDTAVTRSTTEPSLVLKYPLMTGAILMSNAKANDLEVLTQSNSSNKSVNPIQARNATFQGFSTS